MTDNNSENMVDITDVLESAVSSLGYGEPFMCNQESFSLQDSMAALELMDPKMDCCEIPITAAAGDLKDFSLVAASDSLPPTVPPRNMPNGLHDDLSPLPWSDLTMRQARLVCLEATTRLESMLSGSSVAESTYTCLYAHNCVLKDMAEHFEAFDSSAGQSLDTTILAQRAVYAASLVLVKLSESVRTVVQHADIYEEEDWSSSTYGFDFYPEIDEVGARTVVELAMKNLVDFFGRTEESDPDVADAKVIGLLLGFQLDLSEACSFMTKLSTENVRDHVCKVKNMVSSGSEKLCKLKRTLADIETEDSDVVSRSFDPFINRRLLGNAPVRKVKFHNHTSSIEILATVIAEIGWAACDLLLHGSTLGRIRRMLAHISGSRVNILSRSLIILNLYFDDRLLGQHSLSQMIADHMQQISGVPSSLFEAEYGRSFLNRLGKPVYDTLKVLALNRNRQSAYAENILREWGGGGREPGGGGGLRLEAAAVDYFFRQENGLDNQATPFATNYVLYTTVWLMEHHLGTGVELGLFPGQHDLSIAFWYWDFLLSTQLNVTTVMRKAKVERKVLEAQTLREKEEKKVAEIQPRGKKKGKKSSANGRTSSHVPATVSAFMAPSNEDMEDSMEFMLLGLRRTLCRGTVRLIAALHQAGVLQKPNYLFTSHAVRFRKRFAPFAIIQQPPPLTFADFEKGSDYSGVSQEELLTSAAECFKATKAVVDKLLSQLNDIDKCFSPVRKEEVMELAKVCVGNIICLHKLTDLVKHGKVGKGTSVEFDFSVHRQFCSIKLSDKA